MQRIGFVLLFCFFSQAAKTQETDIKKFKLGIGGVLSIPANNLETSSIGGGFDLLASYVVAEQLLLTGDAGFTALAGKSGLSSTAIIPIRVGVRYLPGSNFYLSGKVGIGIYTILKESETYFGYAAGAGYQLNKKFDIGVTYDGYSKNNISFGLVSIRLGYGFGK